MAYSRWSPSSNWYVYGSANGLEMHHCDGESGYLPDGYFEEDKPPYTAAHLQFKKISQGDLDKLDKYIKMCWDDIHGE